MQRAYSILQIKSVDEDERIIEGIATTPTPDRMGDVVEPKGASFSLPLPLLWQHDSADPIGWVESAKVTSEGIEIRARIAKGVTGRIDRAWSLIKSGLVRGLSIGFSPTEYSYMEESGGYRFLAWEWLELSAVTIPANAECSIQTIKSIDERLRAATGEKKALANRFERPPPGDSGTPKQPASGGFFFDLNTGKKMNVLEQIAALEAARAAKAARMAAIMEKAISEGRSTDEAEAEEYDELKSEVQKADGDLVRLRDLETFQVKAATKVEVKDAETGKAARTDRSYIQVRDNRIAGKGLALAQMAKCLYKAQGNLYGAMQLALGEKQLDPRVANVLKAAVAAGSTSNTTWAGNLVGDETSVYADFIEYLRPRTILGQFGQGGIPGLRNVPFRTPLVGQTSGGAGYWVGEGNAKPLTKFDFSRTTLDPLKVANIAVVTEEVLRDSSPSADAIIRDQLVAALRERLDIDFVDPLKDAAAGVSPASITYGVVAIGSTGNDAEAVRADVKALMAAFIAANNAPTSGVWIMPTTVALALSLMTNALGQPEFPGLSMTGGTFFGMPVITSEYVPTVSAGAYVILANAQDIYLGDEGGFQIDLSREASVQMDSEPDNPTSASTVLVSFWQRNLVGFRAERTINWAKRRASAVAVLDDVNWGAPTP